MTLGSIDKAADRGALVNEPKRITALHKPGGLSRAMFVGNPRGLGGYRGVSAVLDRRPERKPAVFIKRRTGESPTAAAVGHSEWFITIPRHLDRREIIMSIESEERIEALEARLEESELKAARWKSRAEALEQVINDTIEAMRDDLAETIKREKVT